MEAIAAYRGTIRINPEDADAHDSLGALLQTRGELEEAVAELRTAIRLKPELAYAHYNLGTILKVKESCPRLWRNSAMPVTTPNPALNSPS